ncbi:hypothetical protein [Paraburkholderia sp. BCC1886]|uniref:hypothetical protein n=1 Tax=Paraburkholderia sp. BCC1886 TaxID=2562670 RepID=UPI001184689A|nr:hypothetical protein [Paraburkholderia sp. BCC1886]
MHTNFSLMVIALCFIAPSAITLGVGLANAYNKFTRYSRRGGEPQLMHRSCAYVDLGSGVVRLAEPGFSEFFWEGLFNKFTGDERPSKLHLLPDPVLEPMTA